MTLRKEIREIVESTEGEMFDDITDQICQLVKERLDFDCDRDMEFFEYKGVKTGFIPFETINEVMKELL